MSRGWPGRTTGQAGHKPSAMFQNDMIQLDNGTQIPPCRPDSVGDNDWDSVKDYLQTHSSETKALHKSVHGISENPM